jgi:hypothetical protein
MKFLEYLLLRATQAARLIHLGDWDLDSASLLGVLVLELALSVGLSES